MILVIAVPITFGVLFFLAGATLGFWVGLRYEFDIWAVALTVALWGLFAPLVFWSADTAD